MKKVVIAGDTFPIPSNLVFFSDGDIESLFGKKICEIFATADLKICNLEGALTNNPERCGKTGPVIVAPTRAVAAYKKLGIDCCMLANNHITDGGHQGVLDTMRTLDKAGINYIGAGISDCEIKHSMVYDLGDFKVGLYNVGEMMYNKPTPKKGGAWLYDEYIVCQEIVELKNKCNYLIVVYHGGIEQFRYPSPEIRKRFHRMADNGANMILSQHTHCIGCEEWYNSSYLLYGQGNFLFRDLRPGQTDEAILIELRLSEGNTSVIKHFVKCVDKVFVRYNEQQENSDFEKRSESILDDFFVQKQFQQFCIENLFRYLTICKSPSSLMRVIRKLFPHIYKKYLLTSFKQRDLMRLLTYLRSEQKREEAIVGLECFLDNVLNGEEK